MTDFDRKKRSKPVTAAVEAGSMGGLKAMIGLGAAHGFLEYAAPNMGIKWYANIKNWRFKLMLGCMGVFANGYYQAEQAMYDELRAEGKKRISSQYASNQ
mmetsp:Transcript_34651/g.83851  ORF Transcript_34651/g.83851 Transcript_34651/m.83851 type:complete len:100 (-) Transcript_34651:218-517(-)